MRAAGFMRTTWWPFIVAMMNFRSEWRKCNYLILYLHECILLYICRCSKWIRWHFMSADVKLQHISILLHLKWDEFFYWISVASSNMASFTTIFPFDTMSSWSVSHSNSNSGTVPRLAALLPTLHRNEKHSLRFSGSFAFMIVIVECYLSRW